MKNLLVDLQNHLFEMIETLNDTSLKGDELDQEIKRALAINDLARTAIGRLMKQTHNTYNMPKLKIRAEGRKNERLQRI